MYYALAAKLATTKTGGMLLAAGPNWNPRPGGGPGTGAVREFLNWLSWGAFIACGIGIIASAALIVFGKLTDHRGATGHGTAGVIWSLVGAALLGAGPQLLRFFMGLGNQA